MAALFLVRHGEPETNWGGSGADPGLSNRGRAQSLAAAECLATMGPLTLITSPMRRCRETAAPFAEWSRRAPSIEPRVSEVAAPVGVGDRRAWLQQNFPWRSAPLRWSALHPELHEWRRAVLSAVSSLSGDAVVFSHFVAINVIVGAAMRSADTIVCRPDHASITRLEVGDGRLTLVQLGAQIEIGEIL